MQLVGEKFLKVAKGMNVVFCKYYQNSLQNFLVICLLVCVDGSGDGGGSEIKMSWDADICKLAFISLFIRNYSFCYCSD